METIGLTTIFLIIGGIGFLFLLLSLLIGDLFEAVGFDFGPDTSQEIPARHPVHVL